MQPSTLRRFLIIPRFPIFRTITPPVLPLTRSSPSSKLLTNPHSSSPSNSRLFHHFPARLSSSSPPPNPDPQLSLPKSASLSQRLKHLIKSYGWYALGVYFLIGIVDFGIAFAAINLLGAEHVSRFVTSVKTAVAGVLHSKPPEPGKDEMESAAGHTGEGGNEGLYAMLVLAYTIHKTLFVPVRVGLTAAYTPKLVKWLSKRGWAGGEGTRRAATEMREKLRRNRD